MKTSEVFEITDYRTFLASHVQEKKLKNPHWNLSIWARALGLQSTSSITKILSGERKPGPEMIDKFVHYFKFNAEEARHFRALVLLEKDRSAPILKSLLQKTRIQAAGLQKRVLDMFEFRLIAEWQHLAIRELVRNGKFTASQIEQMLKTKLPEDTIQKSISLLRSLKLLGTDDELVLTANDISNDAIRLYHDQMIKQAQERLHDTPVDEREFQSLVCMIDRQDLPRLKEKVRGFLQELVSEAESKPANQLYQFQVQIFPVTEKFEKNVSIKKEKK